MIFAFARTSVELPAKDSVISKWSWSLSNPKCSVAAVRSSGLAKTAKSLRDKLTEIGIFFKPSFEHLPRNSHVFLTINSSNLVIKPVSSNVGMKSPGEINPSSGWIHLTSASPPTSSSVLQSCFGWM